MVVLRSARSNDASDIANIHLEARRTGYASFLPADYLAAETHASSLELWIALLGHEGLTTLVACQATAIVGVACFGSGGTPWPPGAGHIEGLYVHPGSWRQGVGSLLVSAAEKHLSRGGFSAAVLAVFELNQRARRFYESRGWTFDGASWPIRIADVEVTQLRYRKALSPVA